MSTKAIRRINKKDNISKRNQKLLDQLNSNETAVPVFTKERIITYLSVLFLPPYGLYRIWNEKSDFRRSEKYAWTVMITISMLYFLKFIILG